MCHCLSLSFSVLYLFLNVGFRLFLEFSDMVLHGFLLKFDPSLGEEERTVQIMDFWENSISNIIVLGKNLICLVPLGLFSLVP
jgi:hypothetical protein